MNTAASTAVLSSDLTRSGDLHNNSCHNCGTLISTPYCGQCGQTAHIHRFSIRHFFTHDLVHGLFHLDRGFFATIKVLFTNPGPAIRDYIGGKRIRYFNYFTLLVLVVTFGHLLSTISTVKLSDILQDDMKVASVIEEWSTKYPKLFTMSTIPVYALFSFLWFRRARLNYTEHLVLNTYKITGELLIASCFTLLTIFYTDLDVIRPAYNVVVLLSLIYSVWFFHSFFYKEGYSKTGRLFRSLMATLCLFLVSGLIGAFFAGIQQGFRAVRP